VRLLRLAIRNAEKKENQMKRNSTVRRVRVLAAVPLVSLFLSATSQAQTDPPVFTGEFTIANQVLWGKTVLQPGGYTISIESGSLPTLALVRNSKGRPVARFVSGIHTARMGAGNALLIGQERGQLRVYSLALESLGEVVVYDPVLAREVALEARAVPAVPVLSAKR
jgi:hypothetical protein